MIAAPSLPAYAHGGKTHGGESFTALQALEKGIELYDRLIAAGKLTEDWETKLRAVTIEVRNSGEEREFVIEFQKSQGEPRSVYFFLDQSGQYSGSNFTGK